MYPAVHVNGSQSKGGFHSFLLLVQWHIKSWESAPLIVTIRGGTPPSPLRGPPSQTEGRRNGKRKGSTIHSKKTKKQTKLTTFWTDPRHTIKLQLYSVQSTMSNAHPPVDLSITFLDGHDREGAITFPPRLRQPRINRISNYCVSKFSRLQDKKFYPPSPQRSFPPHNFKDF